MGTYTHFTHDNQELDIEYEYDEGEPMVWTEPNGDPGTPGYPSTVVITHAFCSLKNAKGIYVVVDILPVFDMIVEDDICNLEDEILESHENQ
jgi:hypothetical protein|tara:strand:+ start:698 stop:973 length:276 start_codon:yes stop_codon:yes gene_type:complete